MTNFHVAPNRSTGKRLAYSLRGVPKSARANQAVNGVPELRPPYTDGQLAALYRVSRADLKSARQHAQASTAPAASESKPELKAVIREHGVDAVWDALLDAMDQS
jgi:hypothetical protein